MIDDNSGFDYVWYLESPSLWFRTAHPEQAKGLDDHKFSYDAARLAEYDITGYPTVMSYRYFFIPNPPFPGYPSFRYNREVAE